MTSRPRELRGRRAIAILAIATCLVATAGCGQNDSTPDTAPVATTPVATAALATASGGDLHLSRGWVAAVPERKMSGRDSESPTTGEPNGKQATAMGSMGTVSAGYAVIENTGSRDVRLVGASSPLAAQVQVHETVSTGGSAGTMKPVDHLPVPAGGKVILAPGGYHLMIMGLDHGLKAGSSIRIALKFAGGTHMSVRFPVLDRAERPTRSPGPGK